MRNRDIAKILLVVLVAGFLFVAGAKAARWLIPEPPSPPLKLQLDIDEASGDSCSAPGNAAEPARLTL